MNVVNVGVHEGATDCFIGLAQKETFKVFTLRNPSRLVIDIKAASGPTDSLRLDVVAYGVELG